MSDSLLIRSIELVEGEGYHLTIEVANSLPNAEDLPYPEAADLDVWNSVLSIIIENAVEVLRDGKILEPNIIVKTSVLFRDVTETPEAARQAIRHFAKYILNATAGGSTQL